MGTVTVDISINTNGQLSGHTFPHIDAKDARHLADHLIAHALAKVNAMMPDDPTVVAGDQSVTMEYVTTRDSDGARIGGQVNDWPALDAAAAGALHGAYDAAIASLDRRIAAMGHRK